jgi:hypothetical protein
MSTSSTDSMGAARGRLKRHGWDGSQKQSRIGLFVAIVGASSGRKILGSLRCSVCCLSPGTGIDCCQSIFAAADGNKMATWNHRAPAV